MVAFVAGSSSTSFHTDTPKHQQLRIPATLFSPSKTNMAMAVPAVLLAPALPRDFGLQEDSSSSSLAKEHPPPLLAQFPV